MHVKVIQYEFKMADGRHFENQKIMTSQKPFGRFYQNLLCWCTLAFRILR